MACCTCKLDVLAGIIAASGALTSGIVLGYSSPAIASLQNEQLLSQADTPWFTSLPMLGALLGSLLSGHIVDTCGRKGILMLSSLPAVLGWLVICAAKNVTMLHLGRFVTGISAAMYQSGSVYVVEISSKERRGELSSLLGFFSNSGILVAYIFGSVLYWRWMSVASSCIAFLHVLSLIQLPESPRWFLLKGRKNDALDTLIWLHGSAKMTEIKCELLEIQEAVDMSHKQLGCLSIFDKKLLKQMILTFLLMFLNQACGKYAVAAYQNGIFADVGFSNAHIPSIVVATLCTVGSVLSTIIVDRVGRKPLYILGGITISLSNFILGLCFYLKNPGNSVAQLFSVISFIVYNFGFAITWSAVAILLVAEIFPLNQRGIGIGFGMTVFWLSAFVITFLFPYLEHAICSFGVFCVFGVISLLGTLVVCRLMPETKGKSLEKVQTHVGEILTKHRKNYSSI